METTARILLSRGLACCAIFLSSGACLAQTTAPTTQSAEAIVNEIGANDTRLHQVLPDLRVLSDPAQRAAASANALPIIKTSIAEFKEWEAVEPNAKPRIEMNLIQYEAMAYAMDDAETVTSVERQAAGSDAAAILARGTQLFARLYRAAGDIKAQAALLNQAEALAKANPNDETVTFIIATLAQLPSEQSDQLLRIAAGMNDDTAKDCKELLDENAKMLAAVQPNLDKPLVIQGKTVDGKDFTTADWKGKVILVDFWATWCGPCVASLPEVKGVYDKDHSKGLEIVGVSNDYAVDDVKTFVAKNDMPWPQVIDPAAAQQQQWNPITLKLNIEAIPMMFLIDKQGVCRSVTARDDLAGQVDKLLSQ